MKLKKFMVGMMLAATTVSMLGEALARPMGGGRSFGRQSQNVGRQAPAPAPTAAPPVRPPTGAITSHAPPHSFFWALTSSSYRSRVEAATMERLISARFWSTVVPRRCSSAFSMNGVSS